MNDKPETPTRPEPPSVDPGKFWYTDRNGSDIYTAASFPRVKTSEYIARMEQYCDHLEMMIKQLEPNAKQPAQE